MSTASETAERLKPSILHVCRRQILCPLRDQILRISGLRVESASNSTEAMAKFRADPYELVLIDVESERTVPEAEALCGEIKTKTPRQLVAFVCNWRVAIYSECPDEVVRTEFDPEAFVKGVHKALAKR